MAGERSTAATSTRSNDEKQRERERRNANRVPLRTFRLDPGMIVESSALMPSNTRMCVPYDSVLQPDVRENERCCIVTRPVRTGGSDSTLASRDSMSIEIRVCISMWLLLPSRCVLIRREEKEHIIELSNFISIKILLSRLETLSI